MELWVVAGQNNIPVLEAKNAMIGASWRWGIFKFDAEAFYKKLDGLQEYAVLNPLAAENNPLEARDYNLYNGDGRMMGIDLIVSSGYKNYDTYLSYTLSKSEERYREIYQNQYYASQNDRRHQLKWVNMLTTGRWTLGLNAIYSSGRPYTDLSSFAMGGNIENIPPEDRLKRLPDYFRLDWSMAYDFNLFNRDLQFQFSIFNILNHQNVKYVQSVSTQVQSNQLPINTVFGNENSLLNRTFNLGISLKI